MLKPSFHKKEMEREKWKVRKGRNEKKGKEGFPVKDRKEVKRKRSKENRVIPDQ